MNEPQALPTGWVQTTLGEVRLDLSQNIDPQLHSSTYFELYSVPSFELNQPEIAMGNTIGSNKQIVVPNTVLLCKINPKINRSWVVRAVTNFKKIASTEWISFFPNGGFDPYYLQYFLRQDEIRNFLAANASGVGGSLMRISHHTIEHISLPLPPLAEQRRIVAAIEQQFTRLDVGIASLRQAQVRLKRYRAAVLKAAVEGHLTAAWRAAHPDAEPAAMLLARILTERRARWEDDQRAKGKDPAKLKYDEPAGPDTAVLPALPDEWAWATVEQVGSLDDQAVLTGPFGSNLGKDDFVSSGIPVLTIGCLTAHGISLEKALYVRPDKAAQLERYRVQEGDILFSRMASVGRADLVSAPFVGSVINYHLMRLRLTRNKSNTQYFIYYVRGSKTTFDYLKSVNHGATRDGINTNQLLALPLALPPLAEQEQIVAEVERRLSVVSEVEAEVAANLKRAERLRQSILREAFAGRLVTQDPADEPASALLARINAERATRDGNGGRRRRADATTQTTAATRRPDVEEAERVPSDAMQMTLLAE